ncbi:hypothetical protein L9F63_003804 [Diploptera punctata]|uniref:Cadherin domain-containing protein n=1 Tax=Diploptera punctata TaxID=6984 RepID=A0AAD8E9P7_DIPPU|nr:hypothetical protein L9F63_003804 [Diploptera punctata]
MEFRWPHPPPRSSFWLLTTLSLLLGVSQAGENTTESSSTIISTTSSFFSATASTLLTPTPSSFPRNDAPATTAQPPPEFKFTRALYNVTIPENSVGKTYVTPEERMGIMTLDNDPNFDIRFKIIGGDRDKFFKAEERLVGDFCFLLIRTRTGNVAFLNRERKDKYVLEVRATGTRREGKNKMSLMEADAKVVVKLLDTNDLKPLFYPTEYEATVPEDTPLHRSILQVSAEDADLGRNGEIYYSFLEVPDSLLCIL